MAQVGHLNELQEKYGSKGMTIVSISPEPRSAIDGFVEKTGAKIPILIVEEQVLQDFGVHSFPSGFLIGPNGRILWAGHPGELPEDTITGNLEKVRAMPTFPGKLAPFEKPFEKERYGECHAKVAKLLLTPSLADDDKTAGEGLRDWLEWYAKSTMESAAADDTAGKPYDAWWAYDQVAQSFKGDPFAAEAQKAAASLLADKAKKHEIDAGQKLAKVREQARDMSPGKAKKLFEQLAEKYEGTKAGEKAKEIAKSLDAD